MPNTPTPLCHQTNRSMYGIDISNADLNYCLLRAKPLCLMPDQHAQVNCLYELSLAKTNHIIIDGFDPDVITDTIIANMPVLK